MNFWHNRICSSTGWARHVEQNLIPWGLEGVSLGDDVLEIGPGFGATTRLLANRVPRLSVLELDQRYCSRLRRELGSTVEVTQGDAADSKMHFSSLTGASAIYMGSTRGVSPSSWRGIVHTSAEP